MKIVFHKYHSAGNDFILIDNRIAKLSRNQNKLYAKLCHRRFGIGADGVILLQPHHNYEWEMIYFNADGRKSSMCGNGGICFAAFARELNLIKNHIRFLAADGIHEATILRNGHIKLSMNNKKDVTLGENYVLLNTGSPHYVCFTQKIDDIDVVREGRVIRYSDTFKKDGVNVNFTEVRDKTLYVRTYERGVEDETFSCGTGVVAAVCSAILTKRLPPISPIIVYTRGGILKVHFQFSGEQFSNIWLEGNAIKSFEGIFVNI